MLLAWAFLVAGAWGVHRFTTYRLGLRGWGLWAATWSGLFLVLCVWALGGRVGFGSMMMLAWGLAIGCGALAVRAALPPSGGIVG